MLGKAGRRSDIGLQVGRLLVEAAAAGSGPRGRRQAQALVDARRFGRRRRPVGLEGVVDFGAEIARQRVGVGFERFGRPVARLGRPPPPPAPSRPPAAGGSKIGSSSARSSSGLRSSSASMNAASSALGICSSLIACSSCGVSTIAWPCRIASLFANAIRNHRYSTAGQGPRRAAACFLLIARDGAQKGKPRRAFPGAVNVAGGRRAAPAVHIKTCLYLYCGPAADLLVSAGPRHPSQQPAGAPDHEQSRRFRRRRPRPRRVRAQGDRHRRDRNAGPDGDAGGICRRPAAQGRPHRRLAAHDDPDRGADRDAEGARRRRALGVVQHLLDPGPRRRGDRGGRHAGVRDQGREPDRLLGLHPPHLRMGRRRLPQHDPRRRRRRDAAHPPRPARREGRQGVPRQAEQRGRGSAVRRDQAAAQDQARLVRQERRLDPRRHRRDDDRRPSPLCDGEGGPAAVAGDQRQRQRHQVEVRQSLRLPRVAGRRHPPRHRRDDGGQGGDGRRLRRRRQGLGRVAYATPAAG